MQLGLSSEAGLAGLGQSQSEGTIRTASQWQARQPIHTRSVARWENLKQELQPLLEVLAPIL